MSYDIILGGIKEDTYKEIRRNNSSITLSAINNCNGNNKKYSKLGFCTNYNGQKNLLYVSITQNSKKKNKNNMGKNKLNSKEKKFLKEVVTVIKKYV